MLRLPQQRKALILSAFAYAIEIYDLEDENVLLYQQLGLIFMELESASTVK